MKRTFIMVSGWVLGILVCCVAIISCSHSTEQKYYWVMDGPCPDSDVRIWICSELPDHKNCEETNVSPALALASVLSLINDVNKQKIHYHGRTEDRGIVFTEYLADPKSKAGERRLGRDETIHFHGFYVDSDTAQELIHAVKAHQHGAE
jgi:hypothetical protein